MFFNNKRGRLEENKETIIWLRVEFFSASTEVTYNMVHGCLRGIIRDSGLHPNVKIRNVFFRTIRIFFTGLSFVKAATSFTPTGTEHPPFSYRCNQVPLSFTSASLLNALCKLRIPSEQLTFRHVPKLLTF